MTWNYSGDPASSSRDAVRFLIGDTDENDALISDEEIAYALGRFTDHELAGALVLRALASKWARTGSASVDGLAINSTPAVAAFIARANELDPSGVTHASCFPYPYFGGQSQSEKSTLDQDSDAVPLSFRRGMNDIPGGPSDLDDEDELVR